MTKDLEAIIELGRRAGNPHWYVESGHELLVYFHLIPDAVDSKYGRNSINFDGDGDTAWFTAAAVNTAPAMAAALTGLSALAEAIPDDAPEAVREMAAAILDAVTTIPEVRRTPVFAVPSDNEEGAAA